MDSIHDQAESDYTKSLNAYITSNIIELSREYTESCGEPQDYICHYEAWIKDNKIDDEFKEFCIDCFEESLYVAV